MCTDDIIRFLQIYQLKVFDVRLNVFIEEQVFFLLHFKLRTSAPKTVSIE